VSTPATLEPAYAIWGEDRAKVERAVARLVARVAAEGGLPPERFRVAETAPAEVVAACEALAFAGTRLVIVEGADAWRADDVAPIVAYLGAPSSSTCLALVAEGAPTPKLLAAVRSAGTELRYGPDPAARGRVRGKWFVDHFVAEAARHGLSVPVALAREVVARVGEDAVALTSEAAKLAAYAGDEPASRAMLDAVVVRHPEARAYELADALVAGDAGRAYAVLADLASGSDPAAPILVQTTLARQWRAIAAGQALGPEASADDVGEASGVRGYPAEKARDAARLLPRGAGARGVARLARLELDLRVSAFAQLGRSRGDGERLVLELAARDLIALSRGGTGLPPAQSASA
jgi:DNA polymerase-3 subunit delta